MKGLRSEWLYIPRRLHSLLTGISTWITVFCPGFTLLLHREGIVNKTGKRGIGESYSPQRTQRTQREKSGVLRFQLQSRVGCGAHGTDEAMGQA